jgi:glutamate racemase
VIERWRKVTGQLIAEHGIKALVVACNTATTAAIHALRAEHPGAAHRGPGARAQACRAQQPHPPHRVMATRRTLDSAKYAALRDSFAGSASVRAVPCDGLVKAIEGFDTEAIAALCARYMAEAGPFGNASGEVDTMVLGCTHYPLVKNELQRHAPPGLRFIDTGAPVAQQTRRVLASLGRLADSGEGGLLLQGSGDFAVLEAAAAHWLPQPRQSDMTLPAAHLA